MDMTGRERRALINLAQLANEMFQAWYADPTITISEFAPILGEALKELRAATDTKIDHDPWWRPA